ncbi:MAG: hypothetical protein Q8O99_05265 [bacterium]|nr:hypothetical protein [bacterium]
MADLFTLRELLDNSTSQIQFDKLFRQLAVDLTDVLGEKLPEKDTLIQITRYIKQIFDSLRKSDHEELKTKFGELLTYNLTKVTALSPTALNSLLKKLKDEVIPFLEKKVIASDS